jgi:glycosyltransferase involved in cell wall biosynthesis
MLRRNGWALVDPAVAAADPWGYRKYVRGSKAELMIAKNMYVRSRSGWFSDRSVCYLASGRPVLAQETGFSELYPTGEGLLAFGELDEAAEGAERIARDYERHARAARALAERHFESSRVIGRLLAKLGVA